MTREQLSLTALARAGFVGLSSVRSELGELSELTGFPVDDLLPALEVALARFHDIKALHDQATSLEKKLETRKVVDRAKGHLMDEGHMTEQAAFGFIQKTAMRERRAMIEVANDVLDGTIAVPTESTHS